MYICVCVNSCQFLCVIPCSLHRCACTHSACIQTHTHPIQLVPLCTCHFLKFTEKSRAFHRTQYETFEIHFPVLNGAYLRCVRTYVCMDPFTGRSIKRLRSTSPF